MDDVRTIERRFYLTLPGSFVALLGRIGLSRGGMMPGADFSYPEILEYRRIADSLLEESAADVELEEQDFVFWMEQGYHFFFFRTGESEDPAVFFYNDDEMSIEQVASSFTAWLKACVEEEAELRISAKRHVTHGGS